MKQTPTAISSLLSLPLILFALATAGSCRRPAAAEETKVAEIEEADSLPESVKALVKAVDENDSASFASLVSYPLERPYPLRDINDSIEMVHYYSTLVDDSLRNVIINSDPGKWTEIGWRGWTLDQGQYLWMDESVYDVSYVSARETALRDSLIAAEMSRLPADMRDGWTPVITLEAPADGSVYRIDSHRGPGDDDIYRLSIYGAGTSLTARPDLVLTGYREREGTASTTTYHFSDENDDTALYQADLTDNSEPELTFTMKGKTSRVKVRKKPLP